MASPKSMRLQEVTRGDLSDHLLADRMTWRQIPAEKRVAVYFAKTGSPKTWDILGDKFPDVKEQRTFLPQTAVAANPQLMLSM